jgi:hypothetical protein
MLFADGDRAATQILTLSDRLLSQGTAIEGR